MTDLTTLTDAELAERAARAMGVDPDMVLCRDFNGNPMATMRDSYNPATDDNQAAELMRAAVAKCGADRFTSWLIGVQPPETYGQLPMAHWLATADARARTCAAVKCLESTTKEGG